MIPILHCDCQSACALAKSPVFHARMKHIDVRYNFSRKFLGNNKFDLVNNYTSKNATDALTNNLSSQQLQNCQELMGIG